MGPTSILVFALASALGFAIFHYIWEPEQPTKYEEWFEKPRITYICIGLAFLLVASIVIYSLDIHSSIGTHFWFVLVLINSPIGYSLVLGILFGLLFGYWSFMIMSPDKLETESARMVHNRWGYVLGLIIFIAILGPGLKGFLERVTEIRSAPLQLSLAQPPEANSQPESAIVLATEKGDQSRLSPLSLSNYYTTDALPFLMKNIISDREYIYILNGKDENQTVINAVNRFKLTYPAIECMKSIISVTNDPQIMHDLYGVLFHKMRAKNSDGAENDWKEIIQNPFALLNMNTIMTLKNTPIKSTTAVSDSCTEIFLSIGPPNENEELSLLYHNLLISFALGSAGANEAAVRSLAEAIKKTEERKQNSQQDSGAHDPVIDWAIVRAKQYLEVALSLEGMQAARLELLHDLTRQMEILFNTAPYDVTDGILANRDKWTNADICTTIRKTAAADEGWTLRQTIFESELRKDPTFSKDDYPLNSPPRSIALLMVSYISFTYNLTNTQYQTGGVDLYTISTAKRNTQIPACLMMLALNNNAKQTNILRAQYSELYARLLLHASEYWSDRLFMLDIPNGDVQKEALRHLIMAQGFLDAAGISGNDDDGGDWYSVIVYGENGEKARRRRIDVLVRKLSLTTGG